MQYTLKSSGISTIDRLSWYIFLINLSISKLKNDLLLQLSNIQLTDIVRIVNIIY